MCGCLSRAPTRDLAGNPGVCPDWELNWRPFGLQGSAQSTEPHQPGHLGGSKSCYFLSQSLLKNTYPPNPLATTFFRSQEGKITYIKEFPIRCDQRVI